MNALVDPREFIGKGIYSLGDVATLLRARPETVRRWMTGYSRKNADGEPTRIEPLWQPDMPHDGSSPEMSFRDLIELRFVHAFTEIGLDLRVIRGCLKRARECISSDRPFSSGRFRTDGKTIFLESLSHTDDPKVLDLKDQQYVFRNVVERTFKDLDIENDVVTRWRPFHGRDSIIIDPSRSFGRPIANASGVPTATLAQAVEAEGSVARVAALFEVSASEVRDALQFHKELAAT